MTALLAATLLAATPSSDEGERLQASRRILDLARQVEVACAPRFRTTPPTPVQVLPSGPLLAGWAEPRPEGGFYVNTGELGGFVTGDRVTAFFSRTWKEKGGRLPEGARLWTREECQESARAAIGLTLPEGFALGNSVLDDTEGDELRVNTEVVLARDPRLVAYAVGIDIDRGTGLPDRLERGGYRPVIVPERLPGILPEEGLIDEALRVYRTLAPFPANRRGRCRYTYRVPRFSAILNEMTPEHREQEARGEAIPLYEWSLVNFNDKGSAWFRTIYADARTGRAIAVWDLELPWVGRPAPKGNPSPSLDRGRWRLGKAEGSFLKATPATFVGVPIVVTNDAGDVLTLRFAPETGLVRDDHETYRPDPALLAALQAQGPVKPFGKPAASR